MGGGAIPIKKINTASCVNLKGQFGVTGNEPFIGIIKSEKLSNNTKPHGFPYKDGTVLVVSSGDFGFFIGIDSTARKVYIGSLDMEKNASDAATDQTFLSYVNWGQEILTNADLPYISTMTESSYNASATFLDKDVSRIFFIKDKGYLKFQGVAYGKTT